LKVVDTTFLISLLRNDGRTLEKAKELDDEGGAATTVINVFEVAYGVFRGIAEPSKRLKAFERVVSNLDVFPLDYNAAMRAAEISATLDRDGIGINPLDALVAAITLVNGAESLVTRNVSHFGRIRGLNVEEH
jgi:tRNA(fMet)-specific endonuclease VapC